MISFGAVAWSRVLLEKLIVAHLVRSSALLFTVFIIAHHWTIL
jgi:hypothetical protein